MRIFFSALLLIGSIVSAVPAQYSSDFESLNASDIGVVITGQDGYCIPPATDSVDVLVYTYAGNALGIPANPTGGTKFVAGTGPAGAPTLVFARAQRDLSYNGSDLWTIAFDICVTFTGTLPTAQNAGSVSTQLFPGSATFILLSTWTDVNTAQNWNADMVWFDGAGTQLQEAVADPAFQNLLVDHWYRRSATFDLASNQILKVTITDLTTQEEFVHVPVDRYLSGGAAGGQLPIPNGFRFFAGGGVAGNTLAHDNIDIFVPGACLLGDVNLDGVVSLLDVNPFVNLLTSGGFQCEADVNEDGVVSLLDVNPFVVILTGG